MAFSHPLQSEMERGEVRAGVRGEAFCKEGKNGAVVLAPKSQA